MKNPPIDTERGTGRTTKQMQAAPKGAIFISANRPMVAHDRLLAFKCGRSDLVVVAPHWITDRRWVGLELSGVVIDHAANLTQREHYDLQAAMTRVRSVMGHVK
jgi:hypothetical protein